MASTATKKGKKRKWLTALVGALALVGAVADTGLLGAAAQRVARQVGAVLPGEQLHPAS